ncbi:MAG: hypothetical protein QOG03_84 [Actinomycetota bacterium]|jgi:hypothetical protein|nr:hypothetical protein [Actinomycetota bacterium]
MTDKPTQEKVDALQHDIDEERKRAEKDLRGPLADTDGPEFYESGDVRPQDDDQTIAPPG